MSRLLFTQGEYRVVDAEDSFVVARIGFPDEFHGHIRKGRSKGNPKDKGLGAVKKMLTLLEMGRAAETHYMRECQRRLLTPEEYATLNVKMKPKCRKMPRRRI